MAEDLLPLYFGNTLLFLYFSIFSMLAFFSFSAIFCKNKKIDYCVFGAITIMAVLFYGLREPRTPDIIVYAAAFKNLGDLSSFQWGPSFYLFMKFLHIFGDTTSYFIFSSSLVFVLLFSITIMVIVNDYYKSFFLITFLLGWGFLDLATNTFRQGLAMPFVILFAHCLINRRFFLSIVFGSIAVGFHWSSSIIIMMIVFSVLIADRTILLRAITKFTLILFIASFFIDLNFSEWLGNGPLAQYATMLGFAGNVSDKVDAYMNTDLDGAKFYAMTPLKRIYNTSEFLIYLIIIAYSFLKTSGKSGYITGKDKVYRTYYSIFIILSSYSIILISMTWFFRNIYWAIGFAPMLLIFTMRRINALRDSNRIIILYTYMILLLIFSSITCWRVQLMSLSYS
ncbi:Uncharacterised protein [Serratia fonticola]|uniref:EpsG family protein n=1 Tax=Serratia fonticola TaxID=47917 RepID=UPI002182E338|nr:EpsG family protein [Serratia fonticola]CAI2137069.1 Uncharacterised protein [Serratia fonticola]